MNIIKNVKKRSTIYFFKSHVVQNSKTGNDIRGDILWQGKVSLGCKMSCGVTSKCFVNMFWGFFNTFFTNFFNLNNDCLHMYSRFREICSLYLMLCTWRLLHIIFFRVFKLTLVKNDIKLFRNQHEYKEYIQRIWMYCCCFFYCGQCCYC